MASEARAPIAQAPMLPGDALVLQLPSGEELTASKVRRAHAVEPTYGGAHACGRKQHMCTCSHGCSL